MIFAAWMRGLIYASQLVSAGVHQIVQIQERGVYANYELLEIFLLLLIIGLIGIAMEGS